MKKQLNFWESLEQYAWKLVGRTPLPWPWVGVFVVILALLMSFLNVKNSVVGAENIHQVIEKAARLGDYEAAKELYESCIVSRCQSVTGLEDKVYPERVVERRISELEQKLESYPENIQIYLMLADLYGQIGSGERSNEYREKARVLDPNPSTSQVTNSQILN